MIFFGKNEPRPLDLDRGVRIGWIKPVILNCDCDDIKIFYYKESNNKIRLYLWLYEKDFVVILQKLGKSSTYFKMDPIEWTRKKSESIL